MIAERLEDCRHVGRKEGISCRDAEDERAVFSRNIDLVREILKHHCKRIGAAHTKHRPGQRFNRVAVSLSIVVVDELDGDLVRLAVVAFLIAVEQPDDLLRAVAVLARPVRARDATGAQLGLHLLGCQRLACW